VITRLKIGRQEMGSFSSRPSRRPLGLSLVVEDWGNGKACGANPVRRARVEVQSARALIKPR
jgi:hypothetical protein